MTGQDSEARNYTFCQAFYYDPPHERAFLVATTSTAAALVRARAYALAHWGKPVDLTVSPRKDLTDARALFAQGRFAG